MKPRVAIAQAFMNQPRLVLLDEPTAGLDPSAAREIRTLIRELRSEAAIVVSSHNLSEIEDLCETVTILDGGRVARHDVMADLVGRAASVDLRLVAAPDPALREAVAQLHYVTAVSVDAAFDRLRVEFDSDRIAPLQVARDLLEILAHQDLALIELQIGASLEDRFLEETR